MNPAPSSCVTDLQVKNTHMDTARGFMNMKDLDDIAQSNKSARINRAIPLKKFNLVDLTVAFL